MSKIIEFNSIGKAMLKIIRDIGVLNQSIHDDLLEWVAEALEFMRTTHQMIPQEKTITVRNYKAKLPCGIDSIQAVSHNGFRVKYGERIGSYVSFQDHIPSTSYFTYWQTMMPEIVPNEFHQLGVPYVQKAIGALKSVTTKYPIYSDYFYYVQNGYIETNLPDGDIQLYYLGIELDDEGYPKVPNNIFLLEAVTDYVEYKMIRRGYKEGRWDVVYQKWTESSRMAINNIEFPTPERMQDIMNKTLGLVKPDYYDRFEL